MHVSALILTRNRVDVALRCVSSVKGQSRVPDEIVILDNGSEAPFSLTAFNSSEALQNCEIHTSTSNLGCPGGRNRLISISTGEILIFVDDDGILETHAIQNSISHFDKYPEAGIITFRIVDPDSGAIRDKITSRDPFHHHTFGGGSCALRRTVVEKVGAFAEDYLRQGEEHDLALRIIDAGFDIMYAPDCILFHGPSETIRSVEARVNALLAPITTAWRYMPWHYAFLRTGVNMCRMLRYVLKGDISNVALWKVKDAVHAGIRHRSPISSGGYRRWRRLNADVKRRMA